MDFVDAVLIFLHYLNCPIYVASYILIDFRLCVVIQLFQKRAKIFAMVLSLSFLKEFSGRNNHWDSMINKIYSSSNVLS